jgi:hypothetical protein
MNAAELFMAALAAGEDESRRLTFLLLEHLEDE